MASILSLKNPAGITVKCSQMWGTSSVGVNCRGLQVEEKSQNGSTQGAPTGEVCCWNGMGEGQFWILRNQADLLEEFCLVVGMSQIIVKNMILVIYSRYFCSFKMEIVLPDITSCYIFRNIYENAIKYHGFHGFMMFHVRIRSQPCWNTASPSWP